MSDLLPVKQTSAGPPEQTFDSYEPVRDYGSPQSAVRLRRLLTFLRRYWWIPLCTATLGLSAGIAYVLWAPPVYVSEGRMWEAEKMRLPGESGGFAEDSQTYYGTQTELLQSSKLTDLTYENLRTVRTNAIPRDKEGRPLQVKVKVKQQPKSTILLLEASSANRDFTQAYLDSLMYVFQVYRKTVRQAVSGTTITSISEQIKRLESDLADSQKELNAFQKTNNIAVLQEEATITGGYLARLKTQLSDLQLEAKLLDAAVLERNSSSPDADAGTAYLLDSLHGGGSSPAGSGGIERQSAFRDLDLLKAQRDKLSKVFRPKHPKIVKLDADIDRAQKLAAFYHKQSLDQLASAQEAVKMRTDKVLASIKEWEARVVEAKARIAEADRLRQNVTRNQGLYDRLLILLENVDISRNLNQETLSVLEQATPPERSYKPDIVALALGLIAGLGFGLGLVFLIELRDDRFTSLQEVTAAFGDSIVGQVPEIKSLSDQLTTARPSNRLPDSEHLLAESYRNLRAALLFLPVETVRPKLILITSAVPHEGKSSVAANLARTVAMGGARVLLVDGDLRKGELHHRVGLNAEPGLVELLQTPGRLPDVLQTNCLPNFHFVGRGANHARPGDLLLAPALDQLLAQWRQDYDYVFIDSCPVFGAADVATLAAKTDGVLVVVSRRYSSARMVREALELLFQRQAKVLGIVFNRADASARSYYYYKYPEYYGSGGETVER
jgi:succinoglycan biosynthesis transport protein ExoP